MKKYLIMFYSSRLPFATIFLFFFAHRLNEFNKIIKNFPEKEYLLMNNEMKKYEKVKNGCYERTQTYTINDRMKCFSIK